MFMDSGLPNNDNGVGEMNSSSTNLVLNINGFELVSSDSNNGVHPCFFNNLFDEAINY